MTETAQPPYRLCVLGQSNLTGPSGTRVSSVVSQPKRLCLLTYLVVAPSPVSRSTLTALFWPESDEGRARNALSQAVFYLRRSMTKGVVEGQEGDRLWVPRDLVWCDARELLTSEAPSPQLVDAAAHDVLEGWNAEDSQPLQEWLDGLRRRVKTRSAELTAHSPAPGDAATPQPTREVAAAARATSGTPNARRVSVPRVLLLATIVVAVALLGMALRNGAMSGPSGPALDRSGPVGAASGLSGPDAASPAGVAGGVLPDTVVALTPQIHDVTGAPSLSAGLLLLEIEAELSKIDGLVVQRAASASAAAGLQQQLEMIGRVAAPQLVVESTLRLTSAELRMTTILRASGVVVAQDTLAMPVTSPERFLMEAPDRIASVIAAMVALRITPER